MNERQVAVGGDFSRIFDRRDYLAMVSIPDEATCVLRAHLILEEVLNLWSSKLTGTDDLYAGTFVPFKTKLVVSKNLGLRDDIFDVLERINKIRNDLSHKKGCQLEKSWIDSLCSRIDGIASDVQLQPCKEFHAYVGGKDAEGTPVEKTYRWKDGDNRIRFVIMFVVLMLKITHWIQTEFRARKIEYTIIDVNIG